MNKVEVDVVLRPAFFNKYGFWLTVTRLVPSVRALDTHPRFIPYDVCEK